MSSTSKSNSQVAISVDYKGKHLALMGKNLLALAHKHGTPTFVYSSQRILQKLNGLRSAFAVPLHIHYAMKANSNPQVLRLIQKQGVGVDVVSAGEIHRALECGFTPSSVIFSGVAKTEDEITYSLRKGIKLFNVESPQELRRIGEISLRLKKVASVSFRLNPDVDAKTHPYITTGFRENKFGMDQSFMPELLKILRKYQTSIKLVGLDFHIGSQLLEIRPFEEAVRKAIPLFRELQAEGFPLKHFDIGGGVGISYQGQRVIDLHRFGERIEKLLAPLGCEILCEPGRYLVADAGVLLTRVEYIKETPYKRYVIVNTGMDQLIRPALYQSYHRILPVVKARGKMTKVDVVGPICESSDWLAQDRSMVLPKQGDILAILDAGAYGYVMSSDYNLHPKAKEVLI